MNEICLLKIYNNEQGMMNDDLKTLIDQYMLEGFYDNLLHYSIFVNQCSIFNL